MNKQCINCKKRLAVIDFFCSYKCEREHRDLLREKLDELKLREIIHEEEEKAQNWIGSV